MSVRTEIGNEAPAARVPFMPGAVSATDVQRAVEAVQTSSNGVASDLAAHLADTVGAHAASAISFTQTGTGASVRDVSKKILETPLTPQDFGAVADNATDDGAALEAWWAACVAQKRKGKLSGTYYSARQLSFDMANWQVGACVEGDNWFNTKIRFASSVAAPNLFIGSTVDQGVFFARFERFSVEGTVNGVMLRLGQSDFGDAFNHCHFDLLVGNNSSGANNVACELNYCVFGHIKIVSGCHGKADPGCALDLRQTVFSYIWGGVGNADIGVRMSGQTNCNTFYNFDFEELNYGLKITGGNLNTFINPCFVTNTVYAIDATAGSNNVINNPSISAVGATYGGSTGITLTVGPDTYVGGVLRSPGNVVAASAVASSALTGSTSETTFATIPILAGSIGPNGYVEIETLWSFTGTGGNWTPRIRANNATSGVAFLANAQASGIKSAQLRNVIRNRNSASSQVGAHSNFQGIGASGGALITDTQNTASTYTLYITGQLANSADSLVLEGYSVRVVYKP